MKQGYLTIERKENQRYYLFVTDPSELKAGDYIEIVQGRIRVNATDEKASKSCLKAPQAIKILRSEHIEKAGGIENIVEQIKSGDIK